MLSLVLVMLSRFALIAYSFAIDDIIRARIRKLNVISSINTERYLEKTLLNIALIL